MAYKLTQNPDRIIRLEDGADIPRGHRWWDDYEVWLSEGNAPEPADPLLDQAQGEILQQIAQLEAQQARPVREITSALAAGQTLPSAAVKKLAAIEDSIKSLRGKLK